MQALSLDQLTLIFTSHPLNTVFLAHWPRLSMSMTQALLLTHRTTSNITVKQQMQNCHTFPWRFTQPSITPLLPHHSSACGPWPQRGGSCSPAASLWSSRMTWSLQSHRAAAAACTAPLWSPQTPWISVWHQSDRSSSGQSIKAFSSCVDWQFPAFAVLLLSEIFYAIDILYGSIMTITLCWNYVVIMITLINDNDITLSISRH